MRSFITAVILFAVILLGVISNSVYVQKTVSTLSRLTSDILSSNGDSTAVNELRLFWTNHKNILEFSINEGKTERMNDLIEALCSAQSSKNLPELNRICNLIVALCNELSQNERLSLYGIL